MLQQCWPGERRPAFAAFRAISYNQGEVQTACRNLTAERGGGAPSTLTAPVRSAPSYIPPMSKNLLSLLCGLTYASAALAQEADTTTATYALESIVVTADRSESMLARSTGSVSVMTGNELRQMPGVSRLADALRQIPGFAMLSLDGLGFDPQATVRGFYGGGETEYILVLLDGRPMNNMEMGLVNWSQIPLSAVRSVEVIRGGASSLYGDAAVGGVLNVVTNRAGSGSAGGQLSFSTGSFRTYMAEGSVQAGLQGRPFSAFASVLKTDGFREHSARSSGSAGASIGLLDGKSSALKLSGLGHWRRYDVPGPLTNVELGTSRIQESPFFRFDNADEFTLRLTLDARSALSRSTRLSSAASVEWRAMDMVRTLPLAAAFADTKAREVGATRIFGTAQMVTEGLLFETDKLVTGIDGRYGVLDNKYFTILTGSAADYAAHSGERGGVSREGEGSRRALAGFLQYELQPHTRLRITMGGRYDAIGDRYTSFGGFDPNSLTSRDDEHFKASHSAFSPKVGVNVAFARSRRHVGHLYANYLGIFKVATMDQLFDQRLLPVPFPPYSITISNAELKPQQGTSYETGVYQRVAWTEAVTSELTLSLYRVDMTDELDFSFETFSYANIASSKHVGIESGLKLHLGAYGTAHANYTLQNVTYEEGDNKGKYVKGIPRDYLNLGARADLPMGLGFGVVLHSTRRMFLDDANTNPLDDYSTLDAVVTYRRRGFLVKLDATNLMNATYSTTGFPDPDSSSESGIVFLYPAAGRGLRLGITTSL